MLGVARFSVSIKVLEQTDRAYHSKHQHPSLSSLPITIFLWKKIDWIIKIRENLCHDGLESFPVTHVVTTTL